MTVFIGIISFLGFITGGVLSLKAVFKKQPKQKVLLLTGISFLTMIGAIALSPATPSLSLAEKSVETNDSGIATITGKQMSKVTLPLMVKRSTLKTANFLTKYRCTTTNHKS
ncbi:hypothetical protein [Candidatus Enterococcus lemimoniae]|uniref:Uncharacterized protein n=1 Tax=Candidatus Enterococcus lemimoniae TaxID=1834167 RepID=A0ABZ2T8W0_9ENTE|nr:hypothetical protein [Enterococcus sp. 12C11_DIV0727]OTO70783.1 hypothetical protein A5866_003020 [Enterococcus sp. 12C11_DIV0727]